MQSSEVLAVDVGATKLAAARADREGVISWQATAPTRRSGRAQDVRAVVPGLVQEALAVGAEPACGTGCGGHVGQGCRAVGTVANRPDLHLATGAGSVALGFGEAFFATVREEPTRS